MQHRIIQQRGLSLIELMIAMAISLVVVAAAAYAYLAAREGQRALDRTSGSKETGAFVLQSIGRELMNAGFYPATVLPIPQHKTQTGMFDTYYPLPNEPRALTDWADPVKPWPPIAFQSGVYGCDGGTFSTATSTCGSADSSKPDTLVVNYFTSDTEAAPGTRKDCTGSNVEKDPSNAIRMLNSGGSPPDTPHTTSNPALPPQQPLFVSNRYTLNDVKLYVDKSDITTKSLACSGNGQNPHGTTPTYQPMIAGVEDLQFTYGVYTSFDPTALDNSLTPTKFYDAAEVMALPALSIRGISFSGWQRVTAVRVCVLTRTLGGNTRLADKAGAATTYKDCAGTQKEQPTGYAIARHEQVFGVRNALRLSY